MNVRYSFLTQVAVAMAGLTLSSLALACPKLEGNYRCRYKSFTRGVAVTQVKQNGVVIYQVDNGGEIIADGKPHHTDTLHPLLDMYASNYNYTATCKGDAVKIDGTADMSGGQATVDGELSKQGEDLAIGMRLTTPRKTNNIALNCVKVSALDIEVQQFDVQ